jgi:dienelactone hydrolase
MPGIVIAHSLHAAKTQFELQDMGILWGRAGCAVLVIDQAGYGERLEGYPWAREFYHSRYVSGMQLYLVGESLIQWMAWDLIRGIDLLLERKDVDEKQIILLGAVAGGGDPAAVVAALDQRVSAVVPFNFGESTPEIPRFLPAKNQWPLELADPGLGDWDTTRCLRRGVVDQFLQWTVCAMAAPRRFVYSYELGWNVEDLPAWARYKKVWSLYGALDRLADAHGFGPFPGPGECWNIGPAQRRSLYPTLERWFGIPLPFEAIKSSTQANLSALPDDRRPEIELAVLTPRVADELHMRTIHEIAAETGRADVAKAREARAAMPFAARQDSLRTALARHLGDIEPAGSRRAALHWSKTLPQAAVEGITIEVEPGIVLPLLLFRPKAARAVPVVVGIAEGGKELFLADRGEQIEALLKAGVAVCLPDVRGTGETSPDSRRDAGNDENEQAVNEQMLGETLVGRRLKDLRTVLVYLRQRRDIDGTRIGLWGESLVPVNSGRMLLDELPLWQVGPQIQEQGEPLGGLLALLGCLYEPGVRTVAVRGGLASYASILDDAFAYVPADAIVPGFLEAGDLADVEAALAPRPLLLEDLIDGKNRLISEDDLREQLRPVYEAYGGANLSVLSGHRKSQVVERLLDALRGGRK